MKNLKKFCLCFLMILASCFGLVACGDEQQASPPASPPQQNPEITQPSEPEGKTKNITDYVYEADGLFYDTLEKINGCAELENVTTFYAQSSNIGSQILTEILAKQAKLCGIDAYFSSLQDMPESIKFGVAYYYPRTEPTNFAMFNKIGEFECIQAMVLSRTEDGMELYQFDIIISGGNVTQIKFKCAVTSESSLTLYGTVIDANKMQFFYGKPSLDAGHDDALDFLSEGITAENFDTIGNFANFMYCEFNFGATTTDMIFSGKYEALMASEQIGSSYGKAKNAFVNADFSSLYTGFETISSIYGDGNGDPKTKKLDMNLFNIMQKYSATFDSENNTFEIN